TNALPTSRANICQLVKPSGVAVDILDPMGKPARITLSLPEASLIETPRGSGSLTKPFIRLTTSLGDLVDVLAREEPSNSAVTIPERSPDHFCTSFGNVMSARRPVATIAITTNDKRPKCTGPGLRTGWIRGCGRPGSCEERCARSSTAASPSSGPS